MYKQGKILKIKSTNKENCLLYTSDAPDEMQCVDRCGFRIIKIRTITR